VFAVDKVREVAGVHDRPDHPVSAAEADCDAAPAGARLEANRLKAPFVGEEYDVFYDSSGMIIMGPNGLRAEYLGQFLGELRGNSGDYLSPPR
jgi:hypothetical protein